MEHKQISELQILNIEPSYESDRKRFLVNSKAKFCY